MEIGGMAARLTQQARKDAATKVECWQRAVKFVRHAEQEAGMSISLPTHLTAAANRAVSLAQSADYVTAVGIAKKAIDATQQVFEAGTQAIKAEMDIRNAFIQKAQLNLNFAISNQEKQLKEIDSDHQSEKASFRGSSVPNEPDFAVSAVTGCIIGPVLLVLLFLIDLVFNGKAYTFRFGTASFTLDNVLMFVGMISCVGAWLVIPVTKHISYSVAFNRASAGKHSHEQALATKYNGKNQSIQQEAQRRILSLEQEIRYAKENQQKTDRAFQFLQAKKQESG